MGYTAILEAEIDFMERVDEGRVATVKDLEGWRFQRWPFVGASGGVVVVVGLCVCGGVRRRGCGG